MSLSVGQVNNVQKPMSFGTSSIANTKPKAKLDEKKDFAKKDTASFLIKVLFAALPIVSTTLTVKDLLKGDIGDMTRSGKVLMSALFASPMFLLSSIPFIAFSTVSKNNTENIKSDNDL